MIQLLKKPSISLNVSNLYNSGADKTEEQKKVCHVDWMINFFYLDGSIVHVLVRRDQLRASKVMGDRLLAHPKVKVHFNTSPTEAIGDGNLLTAVATINNQTKEVGKVEASGLFYAIGHDPANSLIKGQVELDSEGYIKTIPGSAETNVPGLFAAGDVQDKRYRQAITSAGSGCMAALDAERYLSEREAETAHKL